MFTYGLDLTELDENLVNGVGQAVINADALATDLVGFLRTVMVKTND